MKVIAFFLVFGFLITEAIPSSAPEQVKTTNGQLSASNQCAGQYCAGNYDTCSTAKNKCRCGSGGRGIGGLCCRNKKNWHGGSINLNNMFKSIDGDGSKLPALTCRYKVADIETKPTSFLGGESDKCRVIVHAWNGLYEGQAYVDGFDIALMAFLDGVEYPATFRVSGSANNGIYTFNQWSFEGFDPDGITSTENYSNSQLDLGFFIRYDEVDNTAYVDSPNCGVFAIFRPYDQALKKDQDFMPGLCVHVKKSQISTFHSNSETMILPEGVALSSIEIELTSPDKSFFYRALNKFVTQSQPNALTQCDAVINTVLSCNTTHKKQDFLNYCYWIVSRTQFVKKYDKANGADIFKLLDECAQGTCVSTDKCEDFIDTLTNNISYGSGKIEELDNWRDDKYCYH